MDEKLVVERRRHRRRLPDRWVKDRAFHRGPHSHRQVGHQRLAAITMIVTGSVRMAIWTIILVCYLLGVTFAVKLFASVKFVAVLSVLALIFTDWSQVAASFAALTAADAHHDSETTRAVAEGEEEAGRGRNVSRAPTTDPGGPGR